MIFTLYYMYATFVQWWRLGALKNKLNGTLTNQNALLVSTSLTISDPKNHRCLENLLLSNDNRIVCTVVPKQKINLNQWIQFPKNEKYFPIHIDSTFVHLNTHKIYVLLAAQLEKYIAHEGEIIQIENFGEPIAWRISDGFEVILKSDDDHLTKLVHCFSNHDVDINHELKLLKLETVDIEGSASKIKYERKFTTEQRLKYSYSPVHWRKFAKDVNSLYTKLNESLNNPKITIESGNKSDDGSKKPVSEVKPIRGKTGKAEDKHKSEKKNTLEVQSRPKSKTREDKDKKEHKSDHKHSETKHKDADHKTKESDHKHKDSEHKHKDSEHKDHKNKEPEHKNKDLELKNKELEHKTQKHAESESKPIQKLTETLLQERNHITKEDLNLNAVKSQVKVKIEDTSEVNEPSSSGAIKKIKSKDESSKKSSAKSKNEDSSTKTGKLKRDKSKEKETSSSKKEETGKKSLFGRSKDKNKLKKDDKQISDAEKKRLTYAETAKLDVKDCLRPVSPSSSNSSRENTSDDLKRDTRNGDAHKMKPPNVLVYADSLLAKENVKTVLSNILNKQKYTIYDLPMNSQNNFWNDSTGLVVVCGTVPVDLTNQLLSFLVQGGQLLCLCSDLLHSVLHTFTTAEVREHELVRFSYGNWKRVKMMHHIFCYQASPARKQFSKDSDQSSNSDGNSPIAPRTPSTVEILHNGKNHTINVQILGTEETWQTPSLLLATVKNSSGKAVFSQVHLEIDPLQYEDDESKFAALKDSNDARLEILKDILLKCLDMDCNNLNSNNDYGPGYFLGRYDMKQDMLKNCNNIIENKLTSNEMLVEFCGKNCDPGEVNSKRLPVMIHACPSNFSTVKYFEELNTELIGRLVIYADVLSSSQKVIEKKLCHGLVVIPKQQTEGVGRSNNTWLSPEGCAMFSCQLHIPLDSHFGRVLPLIQHFVMAAVVSAVKNVPGYENIDIKIKWPNDLYAYSKVKIGGLVVKTQIEANEAIVNIGSGINLNNKNPTTCINDMIEKYNKENNKMLDLLPYEVFLARIFNEMERIYNIVQEGNMQYFYDLYERNWLHTNAQVTVVNKENVSQNVKIIGIDEFGFLKVQTLDGKITSSVQPDGNSFDMLKGLIAPKIL